MDDMILTKTAMKMVISAGDARVSIRKSLNFIEDGDFDKARLALMEADKEILNAHIAQTEVLQKECEGEHQGYNVLFAHGMDTIMTVKSEYELAEKMVDLFQKFDNRLKKLEGI